MSTETIQRFRTNLRCKACVESIRPLLDSHPGVSRWQADVSTQEKRLEVEGPISQNEVADLLKQKGYQILGTEPAHTPTETAPASEVNPPPGLSRYWPLLLILFYLLGLTAIYEWANGPWNSMRAMSHFMAGFFIVFSFFKLLNLTAFAQSYAGYDVLAKLWYPWGSIYPFVELALGIAYLAHFNMFATNIITLIVMIIGTVGVVQSLLAKRTIQCACLGTVFNLPMSWITLVEDLLMAGMAAGMLAMM